MSQYSIGLDIGIASVGWAVIKTETGHIEDLGVRLFSARNSDHNKTRRTMRTARRRSRRQVTRLSEARHYLSQKGFIPLPEDAHKCPYQLRVKGLEAQLTPSELAKAILHLIKKRGISYLDDVDDNSDETSSVSYKDLINQNKDALKIMTPGQIQLQRLANTGRIKTGTNQLGDYQLNIFPVSSYAKELERILNTQSPFYPQINQEMMDRFCKNENGEGAGFIYRKRPYYHGPGNADNPSPYGRWANYQANGKPADNIFEQLIGKDIQGKLRAATISPSAQIYNFLNDLNNLTLNREESKISSQEKEALLLSLMRDDHKRFGPRDLAKYLKLNLDDIRGWRIDKKGTKLLHNLAAYRRWRSIFENYGLDIAQYHQDNDFSLLDEIASIVTLNTDKKAVEETLHLRLPHLDPVIQNLILDDFKDLKVSDSNGTWHAFSLDTLNLLIPELLFTSMEQNTLLEQLGIKKNRRSELMNLKQIPINQALEEIYNPTVMRSVRNAIKVVNALVKRYSKEAISHITVEMPREKNADEKRKKIESIQKGFEDRKKNAYQFYLDKSGLSPEELDYKLRTNKRLAEKLGYYYEQDGRCAYTGQEIYPDALLSNKTEIDHILPVSLSFDDSMNNKVLVTGAANQVKGQRSPYQAFTEGAPLGRTYEEYKQWVKDSKFSRRKEANLLEERNIFDPEVLKGFADRNLNDTRYASKVILHVIQSFFYQQGTKVNVINGSFTHTLRKKWQNGLDKTRETHYHHAVDACLCAVSPFIKISQYANQETEEGQIVMVDQDSGEIIPVPDYKRLRQEKKTFQVPWEDFIPKLLPININPRIKFSHQVDQKPNRKLSNDTLYSTREIARTEIKRRKEVQVTEDVVLGKIKNIYSVNGYKAFEKNRDKLLMKEIDPKTYALLCHIADTYPKYREAENNPDKQVAESPFKLYALDQGEPGVRKVSKKGNGPIIYSLKYYDKVLRTTPLYITKDIHGNRIDKTVNNKKVFLSGLNPWRTDVYQDPKTGEFHLLGIKYAHLVSQNGQYGIPASTYRELKIKDKIKENYQFVYSLYKYDLIELSNGSETIRLLFNSRIKDNLHNLCEFKPVDRATFKDRDTLPVLGEIKGTRVIKTITSELSIRKLSTNCLGQIFEVKENEPKNILDF